MALRVFVLVPRHAQRPTRRARTEAISSTIDVILPGKSTVLYLRLISMEEPARHVVRRG